VGERGVGPSVRAVVFDIDDTLIDTRYAFRRAVEFVTSRWLPDPDPGTIRAAVEHWIADPRGYFRRHTAGDMSYHDQRRLRAQHLHATFGGPELDGAAWERWQAEYDGVLHASWRLNPGVVRTLDRVRRAGLETGIVTNGGTTLQRSKLDAVGLSGRFGVLVGVDTLGFGKPAPEVFHLACRRLGVAPAEAAYVGDELDVDARGARDAGLYGIWLDRHGSGRTPVDVAVARGLDEVPDLVGVGDEEAGSGPGGPADRGGSGFGAGPPGR
jgi:putative hydrolase of the HAD superfamily